MIKNMFKKGILTDNPVLVQTVGLCSVLAVSGSVTGAIGMSAAVIFVLVMSNLVVSLLRNFIPSEVRIPAFIVVVAAFVTIVEMVLNAFAKEIYDVLGIFLPLIVVNCIILARAEGFASKNKPGLSILDGLANGLGYALVIITLALVRELFGSGVLFGLRIIPEEYTLTIFTQAPAAFILLGLFVAAMTSITSKLKAKEEE
ncbi:MAG: electron transport complex subunit RsxE [Tissierellia bacterium]|nr:electron transport complex subunit RsxE [Tissierellia bacterium]